MNDFHLLSLHQHCCMLNYYFYKFHSFQSIFEMVARILHHTAKPTQDTQISADKMDLMTWNICNRLP